MKARRKVAIALGALGVLAGIALIGGASMVFNLGLDEDGFDITEERGFDRRPTRSWLMIPSPSPIPRHG